MMQNVKKVHLLLEILRIIKPFLFLNHFLKIPLHILPWPDIIQNNLNMSFSSAFDIVSLPHKIFDKHFFHLFLYK